MIEQSLSEYVVIIIKFLNFPRWNYPFAYIGKDWLGNVHKSFAFSNYYEFLKQEFWRIYSLIMQPSSPKQSRFE
ncbi:MAG TPA: hypothetical protein DEO33_05280 [Rikenellaceae bacterium]|nr:hypothetical protein [Rikenellaceae bacterium]